MTHPVIFQSCPRSSFQLDTRDSWVHKGHRGLVFQSQWFILQSENVSNFYILPVISSFIWFPISHRSPECQPDWLSKRAIWLGLSEMFSCNVWALSDRRRGKCQRRSLSAKSIKSALLVASWACQQDHCPFTACVFWAFSQNLKMHLSIQHVWIPSLGEKAQGHQNKNLGFHYNIHLFEINF